MPYNPGNNYERPVQNICPIRRPVQLFGREHSLSTFFSLSTSPSQFTTFYLINYGSRTRISCVSSGDRIYAESSQRHLGAEHHRLQRCHRVSSCSVPGTPTFGAPTFPRPLADPYQRLVVYGRNCKAPLVLNHLIQCVSYLMIIQVLCLAMVVLSCLFTRYGGGRHVIYLTNPRMIQIVSLVGPSVPW